MDVALFMSCIAACAVNLYCMPIWFRLTRTILCIRLLRVAGWLVLGARFGSILFLDGDIHISIPSAIGLFFLAGSEMFALFNRRSGGAL